MEPEAFGRRCILKKGGGPDVPVAIRRRTAYEFTTLENGIPTGFVAKRLSPQQVMRGDAPALMTLDYPWRTFRLKFPDYSVTQLEDATLPLPLPAVLHSK